MEWYIGLAVYFAALIILLAGGTIIAFAMGMIGLIILFVQKGTALFDTLGLIAWTNSNSFILTALPLFIFMGEIVMRSRLADEFYEAISTWIYRLPGGLLLSNILACSIFAAISGSSVATAATIGKVAIPSMVSRGYQREEIYGSLAAGGTLGILIPPSGPMIIYGAMTETSVGQLFMAGLIPGIVLTTIFMIFILIKATLRPSIAPTGDLRYTWRERLVSLKHIAPMLLLILIVLGGIYGGLVTPTEAAALGAFCALIMAAVGRRLSWIILKETLLNTSTTTCFVMFIIIGAQILGFGLAEALIPRSLVEWVSALSLQPLAVMASIFLIYIGLGCLIEGLSMMVLTLPIVFPIIISLGYNPIWFGVAMVIMLEFALITPPVGLNLFVIKGIADSPMHEVIHGVVPYIGLMFVILALLIAFPDLALWLPSHMFQVK